MAIQYTQVPSDPHTTRSTSSKPKGRRLPRFRTIYLLFNLVLITSFLILALITYLSPSNQYMRPCLPFSLNRLSKSAHRTFSCQASTNISISSETMNEADLRGSRLAGFLQSQKELFFEDLKSGKGKGWTVSVGNEAGGESPST